MMYKRRICALVLTVCLMTGLAYAQVSPNNSSVVKAWRDGFYAGYNYAMMEVAELLKKHAELMESIAEWKELLIAGEVPPLHVKVNVGLKKRPDGGYEVVKTVAIEQLKPEDLKHIDFFKRRIAQIQKSMKLPPTGWWVVKDVTGISRVNIAFYEFYVQKQGLVPTQPVVIDNKLVFGVFDRKADAEFTARKITEAGITDVKVIHVVQ